MTASELAVLRDRVARARLEREESTRNIRNPVGPRVRYATEGERQEARRRSWNKSKKLLHGSCPKCGGSKAATPEVQMCRSCWSRVRKGEMEC